MQGHEIPNVPGKRGRALFVRETLTALVPYDK